MSNDEPLFDSDVDPKRIKNVADGLRRQGEFESARMLDSYAVMLAAAPQQAAELVATIESAEDRHGPYLTHANVVLRVWNGYVPKAGDEIYTHPQPAQDAKDAARYRWLATQADADFFLETHNKPELDAAIDAAMAKESGR